MIYTVEQIKERVAPIAAKYGLAAVWVFGSYARSDATDGSDVDFLIDRTGSSIRSLFDMGALYCDLSENFETDIDLVTLDALDQPDVKRRTPDLKARLFQERVSIYG